MLELVSLFISTTQPISGMYARSQHVEHDNDIEIDAEHKCFSAHQTPKVKSIDASSHMSCKSARKVLHDTNTALHHISLYTLLQQLLCFQYYLYLLCIILLLMMI